MARKLAARRRPAFKPPYSCCLTPSLAALVLANAVPLLGVLFLGWTVFPLVLLYWLENVVVGGFNVAKLLMAQPREAGAVVGQVLSDSVLPGALRRVYLHPWGAGGRFLRAQGHAALRPPHRRPGRDPREPARLGCAEPRGQPRAFLLLELHQERRIPARVAQRLDGAAIRSSHGAPHDGAARGVGRHAARLAPLRARVARGVEDRCRLARTSSRAAKVWRLTAWRLRIASAFPP